MTTPHTSWASVYDTVYEQSFGEFYDYFTADIIETIANAASPSIIPSISPSVIIGLRPVPFHC